MVSRRMRDSAKATSSGILGLRVVAHHQHIQVLVQGVAGVGTGGVGGGRQHVALATHFNNVRGMATPGPFSVVSVNHPVLEGGDGVFHKTGFVERVGVDGHLHVILIGHRQAGIDGGGGWCPNLRGASAPWLRPESAPLGPLAGHCLPLPLKPKFMGKASAACSMRQMFQAPGVQVVAFGAGGRSGAAADHGGDSRSNGGFNLLGTDEVNMGVNAASGDNHPFPRHGFGGRSDNNVYIVLNIGISGFADFCGFCRL